MEPERDENLENDLKNSDIDAKEESDRTITEENTDDDQPIATDTFGERIDDDESYLREEATGVNDRLSPDSMTDDDEAA